jgi:hypothetical protein
MTLSAAATRTDPSPEKAAAVLGFFLQNFNHSTHHLHHWPSEKIALKIMIVSST